MLIQRFTIALQSRCFSSCNVMCKNSSKAVQAKGSSSNQWLTRQLKDPYVEKARIENYRCRSAFKLLEMDAQFKILFPGLCVIDCGAAPGSWTQVAVNKTKGLNKEGLAGLVIAVDILPIYPIEGAVTLGQSDFTLEETHSKIHQALNGRKVDLVLSDMAPNATGVKSLDHEAITNLVYSVTRFALHVSHIGASLLVKVWDGKNVPKLESDLLKFYKFVRHVKPNASRSDSAEKYLLARDFIGLKKITV